MNENPVSANANFDPWHLHPGQTKPQGCHGCIYEFAGTGFNYGTRRNNEIGANPISSPPGHYDLVVVGEALGENEAREKKNFIGGSGRVARACAHEVNLPFSNAFITNVVRCRPPNNEDPHPSAIQSCRRYLEDELKATSPTLILGLGNFPLHWFTSQSGISIRRGGIHRTPFGFFLSTIHPAWAMKQRNKLIPLLKVDFAKAKRFLRNPVLPEENYDIFPSIPTISEVCRNARTKGYIVYDLETSFNNNLVRIGLGWMSHSISIQLIRGGGNCDPFYSSSDEAEIISLLYDLLADPEVIKVGHNLISYDNFHLENLGFVVKNVDDTIIMRHILQPELRQGLDHIQADLSNKPHHKKETKGRGEMALLPSDQVGNYNCDDIWVTDDIYLQQKLLLRARGTYEIYKNEALPAQEICATALRRRGVYIDRAILAARSDSLTGEIETLERTIQESLSYPGFNPGTNSGDVSVLLHEHWNYPVQGYTKKTGKPKADEDSFLKICEIAEQEALRTNGEAPRAHVWLLHQILRYRSRSKIKSTWIDDFTPSPDGRLHPEWLAYRPRSGRFASYPNIQNLPRDDNDECRKLFTIQDPGNILFQLDRKQAELRVQAIVSGDEPLLEVFENFDKLSTELGFDEATIAVRLGELAKEEYTKMKLRLREWDPHVRNAMDMWKCSINEVGNEQRFRAKIFVYGLTYGGSAEGVLAHGGRGLSRDTAQLENLRDMAENYKRAHPQYFSWREKAAAEVRETRYVRWPLGRDRYFYGQPDEVVREFYDGMGQTTVAQIMNRDHIPLELWCQENFKTQDVEFGSWGPVAHLHDGLLCEFPKTAIWTFFHEAKKVCERPFTINNAEWKLPIEAKFGTRFSDLG